MSIDDLIKKTDVYKIKHAIRKVVELHSPEGRVEQQCKHCKRQYPCPTINSIEKELL
jgi:hypothetical protein